MYGISACAFGAFGQQHQDTDLPHPQQKVEMEERTSYASVSPPSHKSGSQDSNEAQAEFVHGVF